MDHTGCDPDNWPVIFAIVECEESGGVDYAERASWRSTATENAGANISVGASETAELQFWSERDDMTRYKEDDPKACAIGVVDGLPASRTLWRNESG